MKAEQRPRREALLALTNGFRVSQAIHVAAALRIADQVADGPKSVGELAAQTATSPDALRRLLRALAGVGIFTEANGQFSQTATSHYLRDDVEGSVRAWALQIGRPYFWGSWGELERSIKTGQSAFKALYGTTAWEYRAAHPEDNQVFNAAMRQLASGIAEAILSAYDFSGLTSLVDVAGGEGELLATILAAHPSLRGILFDLPHVTTGARAVLERWGVAERCQVVAGDFFTAVPTGGDGYLLKSIVHDWDDLSAVTILRRCRSAIPDHGRLLLVEFVLKPHNQPDPARFSDLMMLVMLDGRERDAEEFERLCAEAGFRVTNVIRTASAYSIVEARPI